MYYKLKTGRVVTETDIDIAYEVCTGNKADDDIRSFKEWKSNLVLSRIPESTITVEQLIKGDAFVRAAVLYKSINNCTLHEAMEACKKIRSEIKKEG